MNRYAFTTPVPRRRSSMALSTVRHATPHAARLPFPSRAPFVVAAERANRLAIEVEAEAEGVDEAEPRDLLAALGQRTLSLIDDTICESAKLSSAYEAALGDADADAASSAARVETRAHRALRDLVDLAYLSGWTLHRKRVSLLGAIADGDPAKLASECSSGRRAVLKSAVALERAIAAGTAVRSDLLQIVATDVERGVRTRALDQAFRAAIRPADPPDDATVEPRLRAAIAALSSVCDDPFHGDLRLHDRLLFHQRRREIAAWICRSEEPGAAEELAAEGLRQWKDLAMFAECLRMVNLRPELRDHDDRAARTALASLAWREDSAALDDAALDALTSLLGRDDGLDELLLARRPRTVGELRGALERLG
jgi:hypothetical protein